MFACTFMHIIYILQFNMCYQYEIKHAHACTSTFMHVHIYTYIYEHTCVDVECIIKIKNCLNFKN